MGLFALAERGGPLRSPVNLNRGQENLNQRVFLGRSKGEKPISGRYPHVVEKGAKPGMSAWSLLPHGPSSGAAVICPHRVSSVPSTGQGPMPGAQSSVKTRTER